MKKLTPQEIEQQLGLRYAQTLEKAGHGSNAYAVSKDCEEVIAGSLQLLERYNKINMALRSKRAAGVFS